MQQTFSESKMKTDKRKYRRLQRRFARLMMSDIFATKKFIEHSERAIKL